MGCRRTEEHDALAHGRRARTALEDSGEKPAARCQETEPQPNQVARPGEASGEPKRPVARHRTTIAGGTAGPFHRWGVGENGGQIDLNPRAPARALHTRGPECPVLRRSVVRFAGSASGDS